MDIGSAFTFMFDDEEWVKKIAIGGAIALVAAMLSSIVIGIVLTLPLYGYMVQVLKNVRDRQTHPLPEWSDWEGLFKSGLSVIAIYIVYNIPVIIILCGGGIVLSVGSGAGSEVNSNAIGALFYCLLCLLMLILTICNLFVPAAIIRYAQFDTIGAAFQFREIFSFIKENIGDYIIVFLLIWVASLIANFGLILCFVGVFFTMFWSILVTANLYGQLARKSPMTM